MKLLLSILLMMVSAPIIAQIKLKANPNDFIPRDCVLFGEKILGDLNKDGEDDCVLMIKHTDKSNFVKDESGKVLDRNRRGIIVLLKRGNKYQQVVNNFSCFSSENEEGGAYYAPELDLSIDKGKLFVNYRHGRYGYWFYTFRLNKNDFDLIGFDHYSHRGPTVLTETSINFLTKKKQVRENTNAEKGEEEEEVFKETWTKISLPAIFKLSGIKDFDSPEMSF